MSRALQWTLMFALHAAMAVAVAAQDQGARPRQDPNPERPAQRGGQPAADGQRATNGRSTGAQPGAPENTPQAAPRSTSPARVELAVIVNPKNPTTGLSFAELRSHFKLELQFWSNNERAMLYLRPSDSTESRILRERVYDKSSAELRKYWIGRVFRGEIPAAPTVAPTAAAAGARVRDHEGALSFVLATEVPEGVRVLAIDGKRPGDAGYALAADATGADRAETVASGAPAGNS